MLAPHLESVPADPDALVFLAGAHTAPSQLELPAAALAAGPSRPPGCRPAFAYMTAGTPAPRG
jgi:hypothetical protein